MEYWTLTLTLVTGEQHFVYRAPSFVKLINIFSAVVTSHVHNTNFRYLSVISIQLEKYNEQ